MSWKNVGTVGELIRELQTLDPAMLIVSRDEEGACLGMGYRESFVEPVNEMAAALGDYLPVLERPNDTFTVKVIEVS